MARSAPLALAFILACNASTVAFADPPGADWMPAAQVKQKLVAAGHTSITELEADNGQREVEDMENGVTTQFHAGPKTGAILSGKSNQSGKPNKSPL